MWDDDQKWAIKCRYRTYHRGPNKPSPQNCPLCTVPALACYGIPIGSHRSLIWLKKRHIPIIQPLFNIIYYNSIVNALFSDGNEASKQKMNNKLFLFNVYFCLLVHFWFCVFDLAVFVCRKVLKCSQLTYGRRFYSKFQCFSFIFFFYDDDEFGE